MFQRLIYIIIFNTFISLCYGQVLENDNISFLGSSYDIIIFKVDSSLLKNFRIIEFKKDFSEKNIFDSLSKGGSYFACSASLFDSTCQFIGLFTANSILKHGINLNSGSGNFYMQPNGFFGITSSGIDLLPSAQYDQSKNYSFATQSGPMLLVDSQINPLFDKFSLNKNVRIAIGTSIKNNSTYLVFAASLFPVTFYEISTLMLDKFNCSNALNLSGGSFSSFHLPSQKNMGDAKKYPCNLIFLPIQ